MDNLFAILGLTFFCFLFWQQRRQSEYAHQAIQQYCKKMELQLLSVARGSYGFRLPSGKKRLYTTYEFEFSSVGDDHYTGKLIMVGFRAAKFNLPPYRMAEEY